MKFVRTAFVIGAVVTIAAVPAGAAVPAWQGARIATLPAGATGLQEGYLPALSCPSVGNCVAAGAYLDAHATTQGLFLNEVAGRWRAPTTLVPPANAASNPQVTIYAVSCAVTGNCAAVGSYQVQSGAAQAFVGNEVAGTWQRARAVALPVGALGSGQLAQLHSVVCSAKGNCSAVGTYLNNATPHARTQGLVLNEVRGTWRRGVKVTLPAGANANPYVVLGQLACASAGNCSGVGSYIDASNATHGLIVNEVAGAWQPGTSLKLPGDASAYPGASLSAVTCTRLGHCTAVGTYDNAQGQIEALGATKSANAWSRAVPLSLLAGTASNPHAFFYGFDAVSCPSIGNCSAGGQYRDASGNYQGFFLNEVNGTWQSASTMVLPNGAAQAGKNGGIVAVSCASAGNCSAGAAYLDATGNYQAAIINEVSGTWQSASKVILPPGGTTVGVYGGVYSVICQTNGSCTASGSYLVGASTYQGFTVATT